MSSQESAAQEIDIYLDMVATQSHFEERYELRQQLFEGGMGAIWRAHDALLQREVAIKLMRPGSADDPAARGQFLKEARVGARLLHPNVLPVFDFGVNRRKQLYFTMRLVHGASLRRSLDAVATGCATNLVSFPLLRVIEAFMGACQGVEYAHQHGVLHLDLKPDNILVSGFDEVFVIDWGLARVDDEMDVERLIDLYRNQGADDYSTGQPATCYVEVTGVGRVVGTPAYMAPEQALGDHRHYGPVTDIYGLGGILYYVLYDTPPNHLHGQGLHRVLEYIQEPKSPGKLRHGILPRRQRIHEEVRESLRTLERICLKALEVDPARRYAGVEDLLIDLNEWLAAQQAGLWSH